MLRRPKPSNNEVVAPKEEEEKKSMNIINIPVCSAQNFVSCKNKCVRMCGSILLCIIKVKTGSTLFCTFLLTP
jgi:hypothetical protein